MLITYLTLLSTQLFSGSLFASDALSIRVSYLPITPPSLSSPRRSEIPFPSWTIPSSILLQLLLTTLFYPQPSQEQQTIVQ